MKSKITVQQKFKIKQKEESQKGGSRGRRKRIKQGQLFTTVLVGNVTNITTDSLQLTSEINGSTHLHKIAIADIEKYEISRGNYRNFGKGAKIGGGIGFVGGFITGYSVGEIRIGLDGSSSRPTTSSDRMTLGFIVGAIGLGIGALIGTITGGFIKTEEWESVPTNKLILSLVPIQKKHLGLKLSWNI